MSRDAIAYLFEKTNFKEEIIDSEEINNCGDYMYDSENYASSFLKEYGQKVVIRQHRIDDKKACLEHFNSKYDEMRYEFYRNGGYTFFYKEKELGYLSREELEKFEYTKDEESYIVKIQEIGSTDYCFALNFEDGVYSFDQILNECIRIVEEDENETLQELIYFLVKTLKYAKNGRLIYFHIG